MLAAALPSLGALKPSVEDPDSCGREHFVYTYGDRPSDRARACLAYLDLGTGCDYVLVKGTEYQPGKGMWVECCSGPQGCDITASTVAKYLGDLRGGYKNWPSPQVQTELIGQWSHRVDQRLDNAVQAAEFSAGLRGPGWGFTEVPGIPHAPRAEWLPGGSELLIPFIMARYMVSPYMRSFTGIDAAHRTVNTASLVHTAQAANAQLVPSLERTSAAPSVALQAPPSQGGAVAGAPTLSLERNGPLATAAAAAAAAAAATAAAAVPVLAAAPAAAAAAPLAAAPHLGAANPWLRTPGPAGRGEGSHTLNALAPAPKSAAAVPVTARAPLPSFLELASAGGAEHAGAANATAAGALGALGGLLERHRGSWLEPFLGFGRLFDGNGLANTEQTTDPKQYGLDQSLAPSDAIKGWLGEGAAAVRMPEAFQAMMGGPPGIMMGVPPSDPRDGGMPLSPEVLREMAASFREPVGPG